MTPQMRLFNPYRVSRGLIQKIQAAPSDTWTHIRERWPELTFATLFALAIGLDLWLVFNGYKSISLRTWVETHKHPTLIGAGNLASVLVGWLLRKSWPSLLTWGLLMGHLFLHW